MTSGGTEQRKLVAIMFTDMVGYSALTQRNEALALELLEEHRATLRGLFPKHQGTEIKTIGDGFLVEFASALAAVRCAVEIQQMLAARNKTQPAERQVHLRIGIHLGDVVRSADDVHGDGVNIAARLEPLAEPGGICISNSVHDQIENKVSHSMVRLSRPELKNIQASVQVYKLVLDGIPSLKSPHPNRRGPGLALAGVVLLAGGVLLFLKFGPRAPESAASTTTAPLGTGAADQKSIAVLPFVNMSPDKENEYFSDGVSEEILNALTGTPGLRVAARTSSFSFKGKNEPVQRIGEALKVGVVLEGSVRRAGNQLRITAQLINVADGFHLWSRTFDGKADEVFAIQTEVAQRVHEALKMKLRLGSGPNGTLTGTSNLEAYDLYLRARELWSKRTGADVQRAVGLFQEATVKEPNYAAAYAGLASSYAVLSEYASLPIRETGPKARAAAVRALELDEHLAEAHAVLGNCLANDWDRAGAEREYQEALRLNPNYATTRHWYSLLLVKLGRTEEAFTQIRKAQSLDPLSAPIRSVIAHLLYYAGRYEESLAESDKALKLSPDFVLAHRDRGSVFLMQKKYPEAIAEFEKVRTMMGESPYSLGSLGHAYGRAGRTNEARQILGELKESMTGGRAVSYDLATVHVGLGEMNEAFVWLERAVASHDWDPRACKVDPFMADLLKDPRYPALLKKYGLDK
jgi:TolB-like protein/class 3 adenylate cyclase/Flp pilus assembly protein TadD